MFDKMMSVINSRKILSNDILNQTDNSTQTASILSNIISGTNK